MSFVVMAVFLELNGLRLPANDTAVVTALVALAAGKLGEPALTEWIRENTRRARCGQA